MAADTNANILQAKERSVLDTAAQEERQNRRQWALVRGKANTEMAASGVSLSGGSPLLMELDRAKQAEIEALSIRRQGTMEAAGLAYAARMERRSIPWKIFGGATTAAGQGATAYYASH
jgi:hypothetical protein